MKLHRQLTLTALILVFMLGLATAAHAHTLFMSVLDNDDGTVTIEGMYSTGAVAGATKVRLEDSKGNILLQGVTDESGEFTFEKPKTAYCIILDGGPGHVATEDGPR